MFICLSCSHRLLSVDAQAWPFAYSEGPCEACGQVRLCRDVPSAWEWAWRKPNKRRNKGQKHAKKKH